MAKKGKSDCCLYYITPFPVITMYKIIASLYRFNMRGANRSIPYFATLTNLLALFTLCFFIIIGLLNMQAHDLLKLYDRVDVPPERLLFKIPSTWQGSSCFVPTNLEILNCPLFYVYRRHHNMFRQFSFSLCT